MTWQQPLLSHTYSNRYVAGFYFHIGQQACLQEPACLGLREDSISHGSLRCPCRKVLAAVCHSTCLSQPHYLSLTVTPLTNYRLYTYVRGFVPAQLVPQYRPIDYSLHANSYWRCFDVSFLLFSHEPKTLVGEVSTSYVVITIITMMIIMITVCVCVRESVYSYWIYYRSSCDHSRKNLMILVAINHNND